MKTNEYKHTDSSNDVNALPTRKSKYSKPQILLMDTTPEVAEHLMGLGFNVASGSFGRPYKVASQTWNPVFFNGLFPEHYTEMEIVVIDLTTSTDSSVNELECDEFRKSDGSSISVYAPTGIIDPRPHAMVITQRDFERIYQHGGVFIIFACAKRNVIRKATGCWNEFGSLDSFDPINTWCFLQTLGSISFEVAADIGKEILVESKIGLMPEILREHTTDAHFECTLSVPENLQHRWIPQAMNKYGRSVSGVILPSETEKGLILVFPHVSDKPAFLARLLNDFLPIVSSQLFPHIEKAKWIERPEYELPRVLAFKSEILKLREEADRKIKEIETKIQDERASMQYMYDLISETGDALVEATKRALEVIGFKNVINMDDEIKNNETNEPKREDLQIRDRSPLVLVEVKGVGGTSTESSSLQVSKYLIPRMKSLGRTDIHGLSIVNHQRYLPPLERKENPFTQDVLDNAIASEFGLLTTWKLYKLVRSYLKLGWTHHQVVDVFYQSGFINPVPSHYEYVGVIEHFWEKAGAVSIQIEVGELHRGGRVAFEFPVEFDEQRIESLQVEGVPVEKASKGMVVGILTDFSKAQLRKGTRVFRVKSKP